MHVGGRPIVSGVFAVAKAGTEETRMISAAVPANDQFNMNVVPKPFFPNMGQFAVLKRGAGLDPRYQNAASDIATT